MAKINQEEYERKEKEVKDLGWLNNEVVKRINKIETDGVSFVGSDFYDEGYIDGMRDVQAIANQLDEPETLSQEWVDGNKEPFHHFETRDVDYYVSADFLKNLLVPKQETIDVQVEEGKVKLIVGFDGGTEIINAQNIEEALDILTDYDAGFTITKDPIIPQFVADFVEEVKGWSLFEIFDDEYLFEEHNKIAKWLYDNDTKTNRERELSLVEALTNGYEIEQEPKYRIELPNSEFDIVYIAKDVVTGKPITRVDVHDGDYVTDLTEDEIEKLDPRFLAFAVKVEELEE